MPEALQNNFVDERPQGHAGIVRIRQKVCFSLSSDPISTATITGALRTEPDEFSVRGSRQSVPPRPVQHSWKLCCSTAGLTVDDQIDHVVRRLRPLAEQIRELIADAPIEAVLQIVRDFDAEDGEEENLRVSDGDMLRPLAGQHQLLGWHLSAETLSFLAHLGADIDCDEYGA
ncbi:DUF4279 domain-containing protein [Microbacterium sp. NPDC057650]|uniref:DUF4279 domain-containing protein n=1 Tax=unclassified Microbacterium TaxID=2609290 RepID=UPI00366D038C